MRGHRENTINIFILCFICSDDKIKPEKLSSMGVRFWKTLALFSLVLPIVSGGSVNL